MKKLLVLIAIFVSLSFCLNAQTATIDAGKVMQIIDGFGASSAWHGQLSEAEADAAFKNTSNKQLGLSILRIRIDPETYAWTDEKVNAQKAKARGAMILASPWTPPANMKTNYSTVGGELKPDSYASYAAFLKNFCTTLGNVDVISIQNEPNIKVSYESCSWTATQLLNFCKNNAQTIGKPVMVPEAFNFDTNWSDPILNDATASSHVTYIGGHIYGSTPFSYTKAINKGKKIWMTEHYYNEEDIYTCVNMGKEILDCMNNNMNAYVWWYLRQPDCNLINAGGTIKRKGYVLAQFSKFVRPGDYRIDATYQPQTGIFVVAFKGSETIVVVVNQNTSSKKQTFTFKNVNLSGMRKYVTSGSKNLLDQGIIVATDNSFNDNLDAQSITTFVSTYVPTEIKTLQIPEISIFPNPGSEFIQLSNIDKVLKVRIFNLAGQLMMSVQNPQSSMINISKLPLGTYIITVSGKNKDYRYKFLKN